MKFKKDNSQFVFTQEMQDEIDQQKEKEIKSREEVQKQFQEISKKQEEINDQVKALMDPIVKRVFQYGSMQDQFDRLWHDMNSGIVQVDKTSANSWYGTIKAVKDANPIDPDWSDKVKKLTTSTLENIQTANNV